MGGELGIAVPIGALLLAATPASMKGEHRAGFAPHGAAPVSGAVLSGVGVAGRVQEHGT
jgi:hypothetical protein